MEIENYNNYLIYEDGRVYSKNKKDFMKVHFNNKGYLYVDLYKQSKRKRFLIHRLIALHYIANPENLPCVDHIDRNPKNTHKENLRWVDKSENALNRSHQENNKLKSKNICFCNTYKKYIFSLKIKDKNYKKTFKTLEEAEKYRDDFYNDNKEILSM